MNKFGCGVRSFIHLSYASHSNYMLQLLIQVNDVNFDCYGKWQDKLSLNDLYLVLLRIWTVISPVNDSDELWLMFSYKSRKGVKRIWKSFGNAYIASIEVIDFVKCAANMLTDFWT